VRYRSFMRSCAVSFDTAWEKWPEIELGLHTTWFWWTLRLQGSDDLCLPRRIGDRHPPDLASEKL
jgi:hypothetical protein